MNIVIVVASGYIIKVINNFFKEILLIFNIILGKGFGIFLTFNIELIK